MDVAPSREKKENLYEIVSLHGLSGPRGHVDTVASADGTTDPQAGKCLDAGHYSRRGKPKRNDIRVQYGRREQNREEVAMPQRKDNSPLTDEEIVGRIEKRFDQQRQLLDIREKYYKDFKKMLTPKQLLRIFDEKRPAVDPHRRWAPNPKKDARRDARRDYRYGCCPWHR